MMILELDIIWIFYMNGLGFIWLYMCLFGVFDVFLDVEESSMIDLEIFVEIDLEVIFVENVFVRSDDWWVVKNEFYNDLVVGEILVVKND